MSKYKVWNKQEDILTPDGKKYNKDEWLEYCPIAKHVDIVISGNEVNGAFYYVYSQFKESYEQLGLDFSNCKNQQEVLDMIEEYEKNQSQSKVNYQEEMMYALQDIAINTMPAEEEL